MDEDCTVEGTMAHAQRAAVCAALSATNYNLSETARHLRIGRTTLYRLLQHYAIPLHEAGRRRKGGTRRYSAESDEPQVRLIEGVWYLESARSNPSTHR
jgi:hypothetical protein